MKNVIKFVSYVLSFFLMICILAVVAINMIGNRLLDNNYIMNVLESENYYKKVSNEIDSSFENYYYQSGLEHHVIENLYDENKVKNDTEAIIDSIYRNVDCKIETESIKTKLRSNIDKMLEEQGKIIEPSEQKTVDTFVDIIAETYRSEITIFESGIKPLAKVFTKIDKIIDKTSKIFSVALASIGIIIVVLNIKRLIRVPRFFGIALLSSGMMCAIFNFGVRKSIKVDKLYALSRPISDVLKHIVNDILNSIHNISIVFIAVGIVLILINAIFGRHHHHHHREHHDY